jgi:hypothetical protein
MTTPTLSQLGEMKNDELQTILGDLVGCHRDYCSDANAVAEVRKGLVTPDQRRRFAVTLKDLVLVDAAAWFEADFRLIDALPRPQVIALITALTP